MEPSPEKEVCCIHCGEKCRTAAIRAHDKVFCCEGCKMVYQLLDQNGLRDYYTLNDHPGLTGQAEDRKDKFAFLEDEKIGSQLISFRNESETHISFYLPRIHCSSCLFLLENLHRLHSGVITSRVDFAARTAFIVFDPRRISLRKLAELLSAIGYEPYISLRDLGKSKPAVEKSGIYRLGVAGFCFANIMLLSFPEYLGLDGTEKSLQLIFRSLNFILSLPVLLYSAQPFYRAAWKGLRGRFLNIDAPIVLAIFVTFARSAYEVFSGTGSGYFDSMTGIVFFMLAGRALQGRTYRQLSFERDYTSYFPIAVSVLVDGKKISKSLPDLRCSDTLLIHHGELIPADGILTRGQALIDYSFVTGESLPVLKETGAFIYAGGRQTGAAIELLVMKEVAQSYLTQLWEREEFRKTGKTDKNTSFIHLLSRYFTYIVLAVAASSALYWWYHDPAKIWTAVTAVLIIACPCALLLSATFTNGNILRILAKNHFYLRHAQVIERIAATNLIVFDKTGTLTTGGQQDPVYEGASLSTIERQAIGTLAAQSTHPLSRALARHLADSEPCSLLGFREIPGKGVEGFVNGNLIAIGSRSFITNDPVADLPGDDPSGTRVYIARERKLLGHFSFANHYREGIPRLVKELPAGISVSVLSGDNDRERLRLKEMLGQDNNLLFNQSPHDKADYIQRLQQQGRKVMMIGDGLNDAGALQQSDTGIAVSENNNHFTPASDAILDAQKLPHLGAFIRLCRANRHIIVASFILSMLYNIIGLSFAVQGNLSPLIAAILMPSSSLSLLLATYGSSSLVARLLLHEKDHIPS